MAFVLETKKLRKTFTVRQKKSKKEVEAVKGVDLQVKEGEIFGFLGPNGAGKTTTLKMLVTLLKPTSGGANVVGFDLFKDSENIRRKIGYVSQSGGADDHINAFENLIFQGRLFGLSKETCAKRAKDLIENLEISSFAERSVSSYSGGQRRRLDIALGMIHNPPLLFLDEPTIGLDPQSRAHLWNEISKLREGGTTIFFTTHYLDEADKLCDRLSIIDHGQIVAEGSPYELKHNLAGDIVSIRLSDMPGATYEDAKKLLMSRPFVREANYLDEKRWLQLYVEHGEKSLPLIIRLLDKKQFTVATIGLSKPTLDDVFLKKTGHSLREEEN